MTDDKNSSNNFLLQYASFATQLLVALAITAWIGKLVDKKINFAKPVFIWFLPLLVLIAMLIKLIKDTSSKK